MEERKVIDMFAEKQTELDALLKVLHPEVDKASVMAGPSLIVNMSKQDIINRVEEFGIDATIQANNDSEYMRDMIVEDRLKMMLSDDASDNDSMNGLLIETLKRHAEDEGHSGMSREGVVRWCIARHLAVELKEMCEGGLADIFYRDTLKKMKSQFRRILELNKDLEFMKDPKVRLLSMMVENFMWSDEKGRSSILRELMSKATVHFDIEEIVQKGLHYNGDPQTEAENEFVRAVDQYFVDLVQGEEDQSTVKSEAEKLFREVVDHFDERDVETWLKKMG